LKTLSMGLFDNFLYQHGGKVRVNLDRDRAGSSRQRYGGSQFSVVIDRLHPRRFTCGRASRRGHDARVFEEVRPSEKSGIIEVRSRDFMETRGARKLGQRANIVAHAADGRDAAEEVTAHHCLSKLAVGRRSEMLVRIDQARQNVAVVNADDLRAWRRMKISGGDHRVDSLAARDNCHV
jgi:hypothetical protein